MFAFLPMSFRAFWSIVRYTNTRYKIKHMKDQNEVESFVHSVNNKDYISDFLVLKINKIKQQILQIHIVKFNCFTCEMIL